MVWTGRTVLYGVDRENCPLWCGQGELSFIFRYFYLVFVGLLARTEYTGSSAAGHLDAGFLLSLCLQRSPEMVPKFEVARAAFLGTPAI